MGNENASIKSSRPQHTRYRRATRHLLEILHNLNCLNIFYQTYSRKIIHSFRDASDFCMNDFASMRRSTVHVTAQEEKNEEPVLGMPIFPVSYRTRTSCKHRENTISRISQWCVSFFRGLRDLYHLNKSSSSSSILIKEPVRSNPGNEGIWKLIFLAGTLFGVSTHNWWTGLHPEINKTFAMQNFHHLAKWDSIFSTVQIRWSK